MSTSSIALAPGNPAHRLIYIPHLGRNIVCVPREQLRVRSNGRWFGVPHHLRALTAALKALGVPTPLTQFDWGKNGSVLYPILGNDQWGDCFYAAVCHIAQTWTAWSATECVFDVNAVVARYKVLSGGDNGLDDSTIMPEFLSGIVGPNGPRKILDWMTVDPNDDTATNDAMWGCGGLIYTCELLRGWLSNPSPGQVWDSGTRPDPGAGHAIILTSHNLDDTYNLQTWGFAPPIKLTKNGLKAADPELIACYSKDQFNSSGICVFTGMTWEQKRAWWTSRGGKDVGPSPFGPTPPNPNPGPTAQARLTLATGLPANGSWQLGALVGNLIATGAIPIVGGDYDVSLTPHVVTPPGPGPGPVTPDLTTISQDANTIAAQLAKLQADIKAAGGK